MTVQRSCRKKLFFVSTNNCWGASEYLWYEVVKFLSEGNDVFVYVDNYWHPKLQKLQSDIGEDRVYLCRRFTPLKSYKRWINRFYSVFEPVDNLKKKIHKVNPDLIIVSNGNVWANTGTPKFIAGLSYKYVTINHLVSRSNWLDINEKHVIDLAASLKGAIRNYFVSENNIHLLREMAGISIPNTEIVFNPITQGQITGYPAIEKKISIAFVGRLECFHKGIDILIDVIRQEKWQKRPIIINLYGEGPHTSLIKRWIEGWDIKNVFLKGFVSDKALIWGENQMLVLPSRMEGQSISLSEALYYHRSVIGTDVGGIKELVEDNKTGFIAADPTLSSLDDAMERAWQRRAEWEAIGRAAGISWENKTPENPVKYFSDKINELL